jgi:hypothetical protein
MVGRGNNVETAETGRSNPPASPRKRLGTVVGGSSSPRSDESASCSPTWSDCQDFVKRIPPRALSLPKAIDENSSVEDYIRMIDHMKILNSDWRKLAIRLDSELADARKTIAELSRRIPPPVTHDDDEDLYS